MAVSTYGERSRVVIDRADPGFPHGTAVGYSRGCYASVEHECPATPTCTTVHQRRAKHNQLLRSRSGMPHPYAIHRHVEMLHEGGAPSAAIARAAGVSKKSVLCILDGRTPTTHNVAWSLMACTLEAALDEARIASDAESDAVMNRLHALMALGYPDEWVCEQMGHTTSWYGALHRWNKRSKRVLNEIAALCDRVGDTWATPENTGKAAVTIHKARLRAARRGYVVPAALDDDGTVLDYAVRTDDEREAIAERREQAATQRCQVIRLCLTGTMTAAEVATAVYPHRKIEAGQRQVERYKSRVGLRMTYVPDVLARYAISFPDTEHVETLRGILSGLEAGLRAEDVWNDMEHLAASREA